MRKLRNNLRTGSLLALVGALAILARDARGEGVAGVMTSKSLPDATVAVIDPESGSSSGGAGGDVKLAVGDIILFRFEFTPVPDKAHHGMQAYLTEYIPWNTEIVGIRLLDVNGVTVEPNLPGLALDGCPGGSFCNGFDSVPCTSGVCNLADGSLAQVIAETGVFYTTDARLARQPLDQFITMDNGIVMIPQPATISPDIADKLLDDNSPPYHAHNAWDWVQARAYGTAGSPPEGDFADTNGTGNAPFLFGSMVAGPDTGYPYEATEVVPNDIEMNAIAAPPPTGGLGPWRRVVYPGSMSLSTAKSVDAMAGNDEGYARKVVPYDPDTGFDVTPNNPIEDATAIRIALGEVLTGKIGYAEIALRVVDKQAVPGGLYPIDPFFNPDGLPTAPGGNVNCGEIVGSDVAPFGNENPWPTYVASPACVYLKLLFDLSVDSTLAGGGTRTYTIDGKNLSLNTEHNAQVRLKFPGSRLNYVDGSATGATVFPVAPCVDDTTLDCLTFAVGDLAPSDEYQLTAQFVQGGCGLNTNIMKADYVSDELPSPGFETTEVVVCSGIALAELDVSPSWTATESYAVEGSSLLGGAAAGSPTTISGTLSNQGTNVSTFKEFKVFLPADWTLAAPPTIAGVAMSCAIADCTTTNEPVYDIPSGQNSFGIGTSRAVSFRVNVHDYSPDAPGLYPIDVSVTGGQSGFGSDFESRFHKAAIVNVGQLRSAKPELTCPIGSTATEIKGTTSEPAGTIIRTYFSLTERGNNAPGGTTGVDWTVTDGGDGDWGLDNEFGPLYGGLEVRATAQASGELESELSDPCPGGVTGVRECSDGIDNPEPGFPTGDGFVDFPDDPGCSSPTDNSEADEVFQCSDGEDNDGDDLYDWDGASLSAPDPSCQDEFDNDESGLPACSDDIDNDGDGLKDFDGGTDGVRDPGCTDANDPNEVDFAACENGEDDDGDGDIDFPDDAGCHSAMDDDERTSCQNGVDDDGDGATDFPADPGCASLSDDIENDIQSDIKARLLIVFDTSGSMNWNTCESVFTGGDGSTECPGADVVCADLPVGCTSDTCDNGLPDDSRMAKVKDGLSNVIAAFGEVEFGLMRFHQRAEPFTVPDQCPSQNASLGSGGWQGAGAGDPDNLCGDVFNSGDLLVGFAEDNQYALLAWMDGDSNYPGTNVPRTMDRELRGSGTTPLAGALLSARSVLTDTRGDDEKAACRPYRVILVTDGAETCGGDPVLRAQELVTAGFQVNVIGFATNDTDIINSLNAIADAGDNGALDGSATAIIASDSTALSTAMANIISDTLLFERCNGLDDDCDFPLVDEDFPELGNTCTNGELGVCFETGAFVCAEDELGVVCDAPAGTPACADTDPECECNGIDDDCDGLIDEGWPASCVCIPTTEVCNGVDDDCDGDVDENVDEDGNPDPMPGVCTDCCGIDIGECGFGDIVCSGGVLACTGTTGPFEEICDGLDNDCDTLVDENTQPCFEFESGCDVEAATCNGLCRIGLQECATASPWGWGECVGDLGPVGEKCNGLDDDCDDLIDEDFNVGDECDNGLLGACLVIGTYQCTPDGLDTFCTAFPVTPGTEVCNGLDDDCDGEIDEDLGAPVGNACGEGTACSGGTLQCIDGELSCEGATGGTAEVCNAIDDDCDSLIDEDVPGEGLDCTDEGFEEIGDTGECEFGVTQCIAGSIVCVDYQGPRPETCNGIDDNCDGEVDNEAICPSPEDICVEGTCIFPCELSEFPCPFGFLCRDVGDEGRFCVPDPCIGVTCADTEICNSDTGECEDPCDTVSCPPGTTCQLGGCYDCFDAGFECDEGQLCVFNSTTMVGECLDDPCFDVTCGSDEFCRDGDCVPVTCEPACEIGQRCEEGVCVDDPCAGKDCGEGRVCDPDTGRCVSDPCENVVCPPGQACNPSTSQCESDPCAGIECPDGFECRLTLEGQATCVRPPEPPTEEIFAAGAGCDCAVGNDRAPGAGSWLLILLAGTFLIRRRRR